jgi:hypothetical protein
MLRLWRVRHIPNENRRSLERLKAIRESPSVDGMPGI